MRRTFIEQLTELALKDDKIMLMVGDVGFSYIEDFAAQFPKQFINCGVTEQSMMGMAAGMALAGFKPYVYSMIPFVTMRNFEQLRNDVCYHNANVKVIGVQGSVHYKFLGFSHNLANDHEDKDLLMNLPNFQDFYPKTPEQVKSIINIAYLDNSPMYIRL